MDFERQSGIFLHVASLPGPGGIGTLGAPARRFVDFLARADQRLWQFCPTGPTSTTYGNSPYSSFSAFATSPLFVDLDDLVDRGWLSDGDLNDRPDVPVDRVDYETATAYTLDRLRTAHDRFRETATGADREAFSSFRDAESSWLDDYTHFMALKERHGGPWTDWPAAHRDADPDALAALDEEPDYHDERAFRAFCQFCVSRQWDDLRAYAADRDVALVGDVPIYVAHDSADVWANRDVFQVDETGRPTAVAGVPDAPGEPFDAQRWGMPLFDWEHLQSTEFAWWVDRLAALFDRVDLVRIDHFRGLESYWAIPADEPDPNEGEWRDVPSEAFFDALFDAFGDLPAFAEDIGHITQEVQDLRDRYGFASLKLLPFADWCDDGHPHRPDNYAESTVAYTSTHDSNTARGTYEDDLSPRERACVHQFFHGRYPGVDTDTAFAADVHWRFVEAVWSSRAVLAFAQLQDVLGLGSDGRFNVPGTTEDNWAWRVREERLSDDVADRLAAVTDRHDR